MIEILETKDCNLLAEMNEEVQLLHHKLYPEIFKPYDIHEVTKFFKDVLSKESVKAFVAIENGKVLGYVLLFVNSFAGNPFQYKREFIILDQILVLKNARTLKEVFCKLKTSSMTVDKNCLTTKIMKLSFFILSIFLHAGLSCFGQTTDDNGLEAFNKFLGYEKSTALNKAAGSFDRFLKNNFPNQNNQSDRTEEFLLQLEKSFSPDTSWVFETEVNQKILEEWEASGLRKEIWIHGYENYEPSYHIHELLYPQKYDNLDSIEVLDVESIEEIIIMPISGIDSAELARREKEFEENQKNSLWFNQQGKFLYGLAEFSSGNIEVQEYIEAKSEFADIAPTLIISGFLSQISDFTDPFIKRMILAEVYFWMIKSDAERNGRE